MEIINFDITPTIRPSRLINPIQYERTKPKQIKIDSNFHCRVCTNIEGKAVIHDNAMFHTDTVLSNIEVTQLALVDKINKYYE